MTRLFKTNTIELKKRMVEKKLDKINDLSEKSGVDRNTLSKVLSGKIQPTTTVMDKLIVCLDIEPAGAGQIFFDNNLRNT